MAAFLLFGCVTLSLQDEVAGLMKEGQQLHAEKQYDAAIDKFLLAASKDPQHWQAYLWAARSFIAKGGWSGAVANGRKAWQLAPQGQDVLPVFAEALFGGGAEALKNGRYADSVGLFLEYLKLEPGNARAWLNVGKAYLAQQQFRESLRALAEGLEKGGGAERAELIRGLLDGGKQALAAGKYGEAIDMLKEFVRHDTKNLSAYVSLAKAYWESGDAGNALESFRKVLKLDPTHEEALRFMLKR